MAYGITSYVGDTQATGIVLKTIQAKTAILGGITCRADLGVKFGANFVEYYYDLAPSIVDAAAGADYTNTTKGNRKATVTLDHALQVDERIPNVNAAAVSYDVIADKLLKGSIAMSNGVGAKFITAISALAQNKVWTKGKTAFEAVLEAISIFNQAQSIKVGGVVDVTYFNKDNGIQATTMIVGDTFRALLLATTQFTAIIQASGQINGLIGRMLGLNVVYSQDYIGAGFILLNSDGIAYPLSINDLRVVDSEIFNGVRVQGELGYPTQGYAVLPIDTFAIEFIASINTTRYQLTVHSGLGKIGANSTVGNTVVVEDYVGTDVIATVATALFGTGGLYESALTPPTGKTFSAWYYDAALTEACGSETFTTHADTTTDIYAKFA